MPSNPFALMCSGDLKDIFLNWPRRELAALGVEGEGLPILVSTLPLGLSHQSHRIRFGDNDLVLKCRLLGVDDLGLDQRAEHVSQGLAAQAGLAPELLHHDEELGFSLTRFVSGEHWSHDVLPSCAQLERMAELLRRLHGLPQASGAIDLLARLDHYWELLKSKDSAMALGLRGAYSKIREATEFLSFNVSQRCHCHNDLVLENLIDHHSDEVGGLGLSLIDWEYAAQNDPFFDLAAFLGNWPESEELSRDLLMAYLGGVSEENMCHLKWSKVAYHGLSLFWLALFDPKASSALLVQQERLRHL